jgi:hypothetical protein
VPDSAVRSKLSLPIAESKPEKVRSFFKPRRGMLFIADRPDRNHRIVFIENVADFGYGTQSPRHILL